MEVVTFRATRRQILGLGIVTVALCAIAAAVLSIEFAAGVVLPGRLVAWGVAAAICVPFFGWVTFRYSRAFTECGPDAIRSRGLGHGWSCAWSYVADIAVRTSSSRGVTTYTVVVRTTAGDRLSLGMPVRGGLMPDRDFEHKVRQIRACWQRAAGRDPDRPDAPIPADDRRPVVRFPVSSVVRGGLTLLLFGAVAAVPFTLRSDGPALLARLGHSQPGTFTAAAYACDANCFWVGDFQASDGTAARVAVPIAPGAVIGRAGQRVPAVYLGDGNLVYPAAGGPDWIPLALLLGIIAACLPFAVSSLIRRLRRTAQPPEIPYQPPAKAEPARGRSMASSSAGITVAVGIVVLTVAGAAIGYWAQDVPVGASPATIACAEYFAWVQGQSSTGFFSNGAGLLTAAVHAARGQLLIDLDQLQADVSAASAPGETTGGLVAAQNVLGDTTVVDRACS
jgi:hypothetical protein